MPSNSTDVLVVGAGPAGTAAAITLARAGRDVTIVDKATFPRDKCCGDGLTTLALRELERIGFEPDAVNDWYDVGSAWLRSPSGREVVVPLPRGRGLYAAVAPRMQLDHALVDLARAAGVKVNDGHAFRRLLTETERVTAVIDGLGTITARYVIAADGMWSPVRKSSGSDAGGYLGEWHAFRQYACAVDGPAAERLYVWFEADLLPGYAWSFPLPGGRVNIGFGVLRDGERRTGEMRSMWTELLDRPHVRAALGTAARLEGRHLAWPIPARIDRVGLTDQRTLYVGDAAAASDVLTGEGIGQALLTGRLAAEAIIGAGALAQTTATRAYRRAVRHHLFADHRLSGALGRVLHHRSGADGALAIVARSGEWGRRNFARWMFEDEPRAVMLTPSRWHRHLLGRPGAYEPSAT